MATHECISEFRNAQEDWQSYVECLQQYFVVINVGDDDKYRAGLLSCVGGATYQFIHNLLAPAKPTEKKRLTRFQFFTLGDAKVFQRMMQNYGNFRNTVI